MSIHTAFLLTVLLTKVVSTKWYSWFKKLKFYTRMKTNNYHQQIISPSQKSLLGIYFSEAVYLANDSVCSIWCSLGPYFTANYCFCYGSCDTMFKHSVSFLFGSSQLKDQRKNVHSRFINDDNLVCDCGNKFTATLNWMGGVLIEYPNGPYTCTVSGGNGRVF